MAEIEKYISDNPQTNISIYEFYQRLGYQHKQWITPLNESWGLSVGGRNEDQIPYSRDYMQTVIKNEEQVLKYLQAGDNIGQYPVPYNAQNPDVFRGQNPCLHAERLLNRSILETIPYTIESESVSLTWFYDRTVILIDNYLIITRPIDPENEDEEGMYYSVETTAVKSINYDYTLYNRWKTYTRPDGVTAETHLRNLIKSGNILSLTERNYLRFREIEKELLYEFGAGIWEWVIFPEPVRTDWGEWYPTNGQVEKEFENEYQILVDQIYTLYGKHPETGEPNTKLAKYTVNEWRDLRLEATFSNEFEWRYGGIFPYQYPESYHNRTFTDQRINVLIDVNKKVEENPLT